MKTPRWFPVVAMLSGMVLLYGCAKAKVTSSSTSGGLAITTTSLPNATVSQTYSGTLQARGGATPYSWSVLDGTLPTGLSLTKAGEITGTPTQAGSFSFQTQVTDSSSQSASTNFSMNVTGPLSISSLSPNSGPAGTQTVINGSNFASNATVSFGGTEVTSVQFVSTSQLSIVVPAIAAGTYDVTVADPGGVSATLASGFSVTGLQSLLSGCTVDVNNNPSCAIPAGWTLVTAQGLESGKLSSGQSFCGGTSIESGFAHTGNNAAVGYYSGGDQQDCWMLSGSDINSLTTYVSWWEYDEAQGKLNQDFFVSRRSMYSPQYGINVDAALQFAPTGPNKCYFNCDSEQLYFEPHGAGWSYYSGSYITPGWGTWTQWEMYMSINPSGQNTGEVQVWKNGASVFHMTNKDIATKFTGWETSNLAVGGVYTKLIWYLDSAKTQCATGHGPYSSNFGDWSQPDPCPNQAPPNGYVPMFKRYFDDIIVLKK